MIQLYYYIGKMLFVLWSVVILVECRAFAAPPAIAPVQEVQIEIEQKTGQNPSWKIMWDVAREHVRMEAYADAKQWYEKLLKLKPNIIEARWEYGKLLILLNEYENASWVLESLIEIERNNLDYLALAGSVALKTQRYKKAIKYLGQAYEANPSGKDSNILLTGLIDGFKGLGNEKSAFLLMEQRYRSEKDNRNLLAELASLSQRLGEFEKSRFYYATLVDQFPPDPLIIYNAAIVHDYPGFEDKASVYWKKYLDYDENHIQFNQKLAQYYSKKNRDDLALPYLLKLYSLNYPSTELAYRIGDIYNRVLGRPDKSLYYYEQHSKRYPDDEHIKTLIIQIRSSLAENYLPIVENDGAAQLWIDLDYITSDRLSLFIEMADLAKNKGNVSQETTLVKILYEHNPDDLDLGYRLAKLYHNIGEHNAAYAILITLDNQSYWDSQYLVLKANTELMIGDERAGLHSFMKYLKDHPEDILVLSKAIEVAGNLGLINELHALGERIPEGTQSEGEYDSIRLGLTYIEALWKVGFFSTGDAMYEKLAKRAEGNAYVLAEIQLHKAESLLRQELIFEAEQNIRQVLAKDIMVDQALEKLIKLSIQEGQFSWARSWLSLLAERFNIVDINEIQVDLPESLHFLYIDSLLALENYDEAEARLLLNIDKRQASRERKPDSFYNTSQLYLLRTHFLSGEYNKCHLMLADLLKIMPDNDELFVLNRIVNEVLAISPPATLEEEELNAQGLKFSSLIKRAEFYMQYGSLTSAQNLIKIAKKQIADSVSAKIAEVELLSSLSQHENALEIARDIASTYPDQKYFARKQLHLEFQSGKFKDIVENFPIEPEKEIRPPDISAEKGNDTYFWEKLLLARTLWAENRREESMKVYDSLLAIPVDTVFLEKVEVENVNFHLPPLKKSFWNMITFTQPDQPDPITTVMDPQFVGKNIGQPVDDIAASLYGKYRWQKLIKKELSARQAAKNRDYYTAEKEYRSLIKEEKSQETLFDLANIYNRLGQYGKEAELYEQIKKEGPYYPGLDEYIESNTLKRQPRVSSTFSTSNRLGRGGFIDLKKRVYGLEGWLMPSLDQEVSLSVFHNAYESYDNTNSSSSNRIIGTYSTYFEDKFDMNIRVGSNRPTGPGNSEILMNFEMIGLLSETVQAYGRFKQDMVEDTMISLSDSIIFRDIDLGLKMDLFPQWFSGADYRYRQYSDDNEQKRYKLWSMYHLFGDVNQFKLIYSYENIRSNTENIDKAYWSPKGYWEHLFTVHYKHLFAEEYGPESSLSYCTFEYSYGYVTEHEQSHTFDLNIFLEINRHFLLKGNFINQDGDDYKETEAALSLIYRW